MGGRGTARSKGQLLPLPSASEWRLPPPLSPVRPTTVAVHACLLKLLNVLCIDSCWSHAYPVRDRIKSVCGAEPRAVRYADLGGIEAVLSDIRELVEYPLRHPEVNYYPW